MKLILIFLFHNLFLCTSPTGQNHKATEMSSWIGGSVPILNFQRNILDKKLRILAPSRISAIAETFQQHEKVSSRRFCFTCDLLVNSCPIFPMNISQITLASVTLTPLKHSTALISCTSHLVLIMIIYYSFNFYGLAPKQYCE